MIEETEYNFTETFRTNIVEHNKDVLQNILNCPNFKNQVLENCMDLLSVICENVEENMIDFNNRDDIYCNLINFIAENGNPKEVICILNVHMDKVELDFKFLILLYPLSVALQRLDVNSISTKIILKDSLNCALSYFKNLPVAHYKGLEGEELEVYIQTSETQRFLRLSKTYLEFLESMIRNEKFIESNNVKNEILRNILMLFDCSLIKLVFYSPGIVAEECRACTGRSFYLVEQLVSCLHSFILETKLMNHKIENELVNTSDDKRIEQLKDELISYSSILCLLYHIFVKQLFFKYPQIYLSIYNWNFCVPIITNCLNNSNDPHVIRLSLQLLEEFDDLLNDCIIPWNKFLHLPLFESIKIAMTSNYNREIRGFAFKLFGKIYNKFTVKGRYKLLRSLLKNIDHFGCKGQLILLLKQEIVQCISVNSGKNRYFVGGSVYPLISDIFRLPDGDKTDVVNESEWILAALNMLYVLLHRDTDNLIGIDVLIKDFQKEFLQPLTKATEMSLAHYNNEKRQILTDERLSTISELNADLACMDKDQKIDFIDKAVLMLELVRCNISRVTNSI